MADLSLRERITPATLFPWGYRYSVPLDKWNMTDQACDLAYIGARTIDFEIPGTLGIVQDHAAWLEDTGKERHYPFHQAKNYLAGAELHPQLNVVYATLPELTPELIGRLEADPTAVLLIDTYNGHGMAEQRRLFIELMERNCEVPVIIGRAYGGLSKEDFTLHASTDVGALLLDGLGDGVFLCDEPDEAVGGGRDELVCRTAFGILQATRTRISQTEYISCPSCGRTLFDLQETTARIRARTSHLKGREDRHHGLHRERSRRDGRCRLRLRGHRPRSDHPVQGKGSGEAQRAQRTGRGRADRPDQAARRLGGGGGGVRPPITWSLFHQGHVFLEQFLERRTTGAVMITGPAVPHGCMWGIYSVTATCAASGSAGRSMVSVNMTMVNTMTTAWMSVRYLGSISG